MRTYLPPECKYTVDGGHIITDGSVRKKVSGTSMGGILNVSPFTTPFQIACNLLGLAREDISGKPAVKVGQVLEDPIIRYAGRAYSQYGSFCSADEVYEKRAGDHDSWVSDFEDDVFAGHVDGIVFKDDGTDYILEIKTTKNLDSWKEGVPEYYRLQVSLYDHFITKKGKAYVVLGMVHDATYKDVTSWIPTENSVVMFEMAVDEDFDETLEQVRKWYSEYILNNTTPDYDPTNEGDVEMYNHLCNLTKDLDEVRVDVDRYSEVVSRIAQAEETIRDLYDEKEMLKAELKDYLDVNQLSSLTTSEGDAMVTLSVRKSTYLDEKALEADLTDLSKYRKERISKTLTIKNIKRKQ